MDSEETNIILDIGSGFIKAGLSGQDQPAVTVPTIVNQGDQPPIVSGVVKNWDDL